MPSNDPAQGSLVDTLRHSGLLLLSPEKTLDCLLKKGFIAYRAELSLRHPKRKLSEDGNEAAVNFPRLNVKLSCCIIYL